MSVDGETIWDKDVRGASLDLELIVETNDDRIQAPA